MKENPSYTTTAKERLSFWTYFIGQNVYYNITAIYISTYLLMLGIDPIKSGSVLLAVKVWDAINDPLFGFIFDKVKFKSRLKCLPWLRIATMLIPIVTILLFSIPNTLSENGMLIWFGVAYILWDTVYTLTDVPAYSMLNTMTANLEERTALLSVNRVFSGAGVVIYGVGISLMTDSIGLSATWAVALLSVFSAATMIPMCINCKERNYDPEDEPENFTFREMFTYLRKNKYLLLYYTGYCFTDALKTSNAVSLFVCFYLFKSADFNALLTILNMVPGVFAAMAMPWLLKRFNKIATLATCNLISIVLGFVIYLLGPQNWVLFIILTVVRCVPMSVVGIMNYMFTPDCAEYGQYKSGISAKGITFAIQTFSVKITAAISSALAMFLLGLFSWTTVKAESFQELEALGITQTPLALKGLWIIYALVPLIGMSISALFYMLYKLNDKDVQIMAQCNAGEITREEAEQRLSRKY